MWEILQEERKKKSPLKYSLKLIFQTIAVRFWEEIYDTLIVGHKDVPGMIYKITEILYDDKVNINSLSLHRSEKAGDAVVIIEVDDKLEDNIKQELLSIENILNVTVLHAL